jgi:hypothetical protein
MSKMGRIKIAYIAYIAYIVAIPLLGGVRDG